MKLPRNMQTEQEKNEKKRKSLIIGLCVSVGILALITIILLCITINKKVKSAENGETNTPQTTAAVSAAPSAELKNTDKPKATDTPAAKPTEKATSTPEPTQTPEPTATPTDTPTPEPTEATTPTPAPTTEAGVPERDPNRGPRVLIDPGHGGNDGGTNGYRSERDEDGNRYWECDITLAISLLLRDKLQAAGIEVFMTREEDFYCGTPTERKKYADSLDIDCFVSVHLNSAPTADGTDITGTEVYYNKTRHKNSPKLAQFILDELLAKNGSRNRGVKNDEGLAIPKCQHPSCLVECEFLSADEKFPLLIDPAYQDLTAEGIANGIIKYLDWAGVTN